MKISIPEPCSEDWSKMTPTEQGAFCQKCALEVSDFTNKSSVEIKSILTEKIQSKQRVCGHIENRQMVEFNHEFIPWKSDQESFRAIWMFSLIAVFGLTLFSCQSTFSKEVVEKMKTNTEMMLEEEKDTLDLAILNDSIEALNKQDSLNAWTEILQPITGTSVITFDGLVDLETDIPKLDEIICVVEWMGDLVISGAFGPAPEDQIDVTQFYTPTSHRDLPALQPNRPNPPRINERNQQNSPRLNAKLEKGRPEFEAYISPLPIDKTSKLFVTIPEEGRLKLSIWEVPSLSKMHSENIDLVFGNHAIAINFHDFAIGKYAVQLTWEEEKVVIPFEVTPESSS